MHKQSASVSARRGLDELANRTNDEHPWVQCDPLGTLNRQIHKSAFWLGVVTMVALPRFTHLDHDVCTPTATYCLFLPASMSVAGSLELLIFNLFIWTLQVLPGRQEIRKHGLWFTSQAMPPLLIHQCVLHPITRFYPRLRGLTLDTTRRIFNSAFETEHSAEDI